MTKTFIFMLLFNSLAYKSVSTEAGFITNQQDQITIMQQLAAMNPVMDYAILKGYLDKTQGYKVISLSNTEFVWDSSPWSSGTAPVFILSNEMNTNYLIGLISEGINYHDNTIVMSEKARRFIMEALYFEGYEKFDLDGLELISNDYHIAYTNTMVGYRSLGFEIPTNEGIPDSILK